MALKKVQRTPGRRGANQPPRSRAFFLELLLNMLIFALCAIVALQVFVEGKIATDESDALTVLTLDAETLAETYKVTDGDLSSLEQHVVDSGFAGVLTEEETLTYYYDNNLEPSDESNARYSLVLSSVEGASDLVHAVEITGYDAEDPLFSFEATQYRPEEGR